jgi:hypothetical protein
VAVSNTSAVNATNVDGTTALSLGVANADGGSIAAATSHSTNVNGGIASTSSALSNATNNGTAISQSNAVNNGGIIGDSTAVATSNNAGLSAAMGNARATGAGSVASTTNVANNVVAPGDSTGFSKSLTVGCTSGSNGCGTQYAAAVNNGTGQGVAVAGGVVQSTSGGQVLGLSTAQTSTGVNAPLTVHVGAGTAPGGGSFQTVTINQGSTQAATAVSTN